MRVARIALIGIAILTAGVAAVGRAAVSAADVILPAPHPRPTIRAEALRPAPAVEGCGSTPISCNTDVRGQLLGGDCQSSNGALFDEYVFPGAAQELISVTVRPLTGGYTNAWASFVVPPTTTSMAPLIAGGPAATVRYRLPVSGTWRTQVGTNLTFSAGSYLLEMSCDDSAPPNQLLECIEQDLLCGQQATWELSSLSCVSSSDPTRSYAMYRVWGVAGDALQLQLQSNEFDPQFGVYDFEQGAAALAQSTALNANTDVLTFSVPRDAFYDIVVTSGNANGAGQYKLLLDCNRSGCLIPIIIKQPEDVVVPRFANAQLSVEATALGIDIDYEWFDAAGSQSNVGSGPKYNTVPITEPRSYFVTATTPCGTTTSRIVNVRPATVDPPPPPPVPPRRRAARH